MSFSYYSFILKNNGTLWGCGDNSYGELGLGDTTDRKTFVHITTNADNIKSVYCGYQHTLILKNDGTLWGCGYNGYGQLGLGDVDKKIVFTQIVTNADNIKSIYCGDKHTIILKNDGTLWGCGENDYGQLGLGDTNNRDTFTQITTNTDNIKSVYCGLRQTLILKNDGTLWVCGQNNSGQLGLGDTDDRNTFTRITTNANNIKSVCCSGFSMIVLKNDGTLWGCGRNDCSQLGLGDTNSRTTLTIMGINTNDIELINCGYDYTLILKNDGTLWGCGANGSGQLGLGDTDDRNIFTQITTNTNDIKSIYCGHNHTLILKNDGTLWGSGWNGYGQLGLRGISNRTTFTQITTNVDNIISLANNYPSTSSTIKIYDLKTGLIETLDTNNFRNIPIDKFEKLKVLYTKPLSTILNCAVSFDKKQTWKTFDGLNWNVVSDISESNIIMNCMDVGVLNTLDKNKLISGGFTGDLDFKIAMKTNDKTATSSVTKIYIEYK